MYRYMYIYIIYAYILSSLLKLQLQPSLVHSKACLGETSPGSKKRHIIFLHLPLSIYEPLWPLFLGLLYPVIFYSTICR